MTPGSWWVNKRTGQRLAVAKNRMSLSRRGGRFTAFRGLGRPEGRFPCYLEGAELFLAWLTDDELHGGWKRLRLKADKGFIPSWIRKPPQFNDFLYAPPNPPYTPFEPYWLSVQGIHFGWLCLTGTVQTESTIVRTKLPPLPSTDLPPWMAKTPPRTNEFSDNFDWGIQAYNTFFLPASEVVPHLTPKYNAVRPTIYDHLAMDVGQHG